MRTTIRCFSFLLITLALALPGLGKEPLSRGDSFWGIHFDLHPGQGDTSLGADITEENIREFLTRVQPDYVQYDCKGHPGWLGYPSKVSKSAGMKQDSLAFWRKVTKEEGVGLFIHFSGVWDSLAIEEHPEWAVINADGSLNKNNTSVFSPYVDERMIPQLKEVTDQYLLDGVWADGECWAASFDYSEAALAAWKAETGYDTAPKSKDEPHWLEWKNFHRAHFRRYLAHWVDTLHKHNPALQITSNWMYTTFAPIPAEINLDFISGDYTHSESLYNVRLDARYIANAGKPWDLMAWGFTQGPDQGWTLKPAQQLMQEGAVVMMQGGGYQIYNHTTRTGYIYPALINMLEEVGDFVRARREWAHKSTAIPQVALLLSTETYLANCERIYAPWSSDYDKLKGILDLYVAMQYSVDVLAEHQLQTRMAEYPLIVIPHATTLKPEFIDALLAYVEKGGSLLLLGTEAASLFKDHLGVEFIGEPKEAGFDELYTNTRRTETLGTVNVPGKWQAVQLTTAKPGGFRYESRDTRKGGIPAASIQTLGKGKIAAVYGPVAASAYQGHSTHLRTFLHNLSKELFPKPAFTIEGAPYLEVSLRHTAKGQRSIHLLNTSGAPTSSRFGFVDGIPSVGPISITIPMEKAPDSVTLQPSKTSLEWDYSDGALQVKIPYLHIYEILVIE